MRKADRTPGKLYADDRKKYHKAVEKARTSAYSLKEFFDDYSKILREQFQAEVVFTYLPDHIVEQNSSHKSPIGKPQAWTQEQKDDPDIPNTYLAFTGMIEGSLVSNNGPYDDSEFEGYALFWEFGALKLNFTNGTPNIIAIIEAFE